MASDIEVIKESLKSNEILGLVVPEIGYDETLIKVACALSREYNKILYISVNKPYDLLTDKLNQNKTDLSRFYFIDCITRTAKNIQSTENCKYVSSPKALNEIHSAVFDAITEKKIGVVLIDSPQVLSTYYEHTDLLRFMHLLMVKLVSSKCKGIFPFPKEGAGPVRRSIEMFTDKILYLSGKNECSSSGNFGMDFTAKLYGIILLPKKILLAVQARIVSE